MTDDRKRALVTALVVGALVVCSAVALASPLVDARPAHEIPVTEQPEADLSDPTADGWSSVPAADVALSSAPSSVPDAADTSIEQVHVQAVRSDGQFYVRLQWEDGTQNVSAESPRQFVDAAAVQFPADTSSRPPIAMGGRDNQVNVWYWSGNGGTQELLAGGAGSTTAFPSPSVAANATYEDGTWTVVYTRDIASSGANRTDLGSVDTLDVAFAVWNGGNGERAGRKAVSEWHYFLTGTGPQGPPYQTLLWTIAGVAIVAVVAVTAFGVLRARGSGGSEGGGS
ncbi:ethylbenzene dehydrogenase-related protein [Haloplanus aerogenes]|uniref:Complex iron-sulfur molybdoenzyme family reductase subunit gamma n=1 Tax=Haloplanus aerogenes TaxID=660522 RepID=A0A3M0E0T2_9EURY|nr:ethylbenzene dehydrogenase-related protein [Haloplanus aerogenes]AZH25806.1 DMSO reductase [Haloplanus aerogenes]RMB25546.1 complex iron-sulfur molybdoenzyme family reductase subunit gamma [Haloplanus aerogenes]